MVNNTYAHGYALSLYSVCLENNVVDEILYNYKTLSRIADKEVINFLNIPLWPNRHIFFRISPF